MVSFNTCITLSYFIPKKYLFLSKMAVNNSFLLSLWQWKCLSRLIALMIRSVYISRNVDESMTEGFEWVFLIPWRDACLRERSSSGWPYFLGSRGMCRLSQLHTVGLCSANSVVSGGKTNYITGVRHASLARQTDCASYSRLALCIPV